MKKALKDIGFIGIGKMGHAMAQRGLNLGNSVRVWNRRDTPMLSQIIKCGALRAHSISELISQTNNIILTLADDHAITEVARNIEVAIENGLNHRELEQKTFIDCSSTSPDLTRRIATSLKTKYKMAWIDAPVSGGPTSAMTGKLAMMVGGNSADVAKVKDVLLNFTPRIHYIGESGAGQKAKLSNQIILSCFFLALAELIFSRSKIKLRISLSVIHILNKLFTDIVVSSLIIAIAEATKLAEICEIDFNLAEVFQGGFADSKLLQSIYKWRKEKDFPISTMGDLLNSIKEIRTIAHQLNLQQPFFEFIEDYLHTRISADDMDRKLAELIDLLSEPIQLHILVP